MSRAIRILTATALLAVGALTFGATGASANPGHATACVFAEGLAGTVDPDGEGDEGVESIQKDFGIGVPEHTASTPGHYGPDPAQPLFFEVGEDTDQGNYTFNGAAQCIDSNEVLAGPEPANIVSSGRYRNSVCGSGTAWSDPLAGHVTTVDSPVGTPIEYDNIKFEIAFRGGQGTLDVQAASHNGTAGGSGAGYVKIAPNAPTGGNCVNADVRSFTVQGVFAVRF